MSKQTEAATREVCVIESSPFVLVPFQKFALLNEAEREQIKLEHPEFSIREATLEERRQIQAEENPWE